VYCTEKSKLGRKSPIFAVEMGTGSGEQDGGGVAARGRYTAEGSSEGELRRRSPAEGQQRRDSSGAERLRARKKRPAGGLQVVSGISRGYFCKFYRPTFSPGRREYVFSCSSTD
jgi:hypothetical protein